MYFLTDQNQGRFPCEYNFSSIIPAQTPIGKSSALLDPNHTHFILVDSKKEEFGGEIDFRARLEEFRNKRKAEDEANTSGWSLLYVLGEKKGAERGRRRGRAGEGEKEQERMGSLSNGKCMEGIGLYK